MSKKDFVLLSDPGRGTTARASSVLQKNFKLYGPKNALDYGNNSNCWNSDGAKEGSGNNVEAIWFQVDFGRPVVASAIKLQFQAGFSAETINIYSLEKENSWKLLLEEEEAEDDHELQSFDLPSAATTTALKVSFQECTDFYGRVTIYKVEVWGTEAKNAEKR